ncbi:acyltransferase family protein [Candidatus Enterovibrio escicola]|uniref:acyltransferase family protein n=2 Tax=Candidatus Enterovibrio escicola TaxID=1927127 RepID=UPI001237CFB7|nr:acyltransferase [Candidatus Enterovibrio escacola]
MNLNQACIKQKKSPSLEIIPLTTFRFVTAFIVFLFHVHIHFNWRTGIKYIDRFIWDGAIFMSAFFVLSGFILTYTYYHTEFVGNATNLKNYYIKRFARIYPVYIVLLLLTSYQLLDLHASQIVCLIVANVFLVEAFFYILFPHWVNGGMWSLSVEAFFYSIFPFLKYLLNFLCEHKIKLFIIAYLLAMFPSMIRIAFDETKDIHVNPIFRLGEFCLGLLTCMVYKTCKNYSTKYHFVILSALCLLLFVSVVVLGKIIDDWFFTGFNFIVLPILCYVIYLLAQLSKDNNKYTYALLANPVCQYLGKISYSFYMTQFLVLSLFGKEVLADLIHNKHVLMLTLLTLNLLLASIFYELLEKRMRRKIVRRFVQ